jgi:hypothetical protein
VVVVVVVFKEDHHNLEEMEVTEVEQQQEMDLQVEQEELIKTTVV